MTVIQSVTHLFETEFNVHKQGNDQIALTYYEMFHNAGHKPFNQMVQLMRKGEIPAYESVTRAVRKVREDNPQWKKPEIKKQEDVEHAKKEIGLKTSLFDFV